MGLYPVAVVQYTKKAKITHTHSKTIHNKQNYKHNKVHTLKTQNGNFNLTKDLSRRISINNNLAYALLYNNINNSCYYQFRIIVFWPETQWKILRIRRDMLLPSSGQECNGLNRQDKRKVDYQIR